MLCMMTSSNAIAVPLAQDGLRVEGEEACLGKVLDNELSFGLNCRSFSLMKWCLFGLGEIVALSHTARFGAFSTENSCNCDSFRQKHLGDGSSQTHACEAVEAARQSCLFRCCRDVLRRHSAPSCRVENNRGRRKSSCFSVQRLSLNHRSWCCIVVTLVLAAFVVLRASRNTDCPLSTPPIVGSSILLLLPLFLPLPLPLPLPFPFFFPFPFPSPVPLTL